ncbi:MAG: carboxypeptidase-like regulatory domain-containing protein [Bryobacteraceae bacterium]
MLRIRALVWLTFLACATPGAAQTLGEITGEVRDASGAIIAGATVTVSNPAIGLSRSAVTNESGVYGFPSLQPGTWDVKVEMRGFRGAVRNNVELQVQQTARIDFALQLGDVTEVVEVRDTGALLTTENATVGTVIENRRIVDLPLNGRNFLQLVALSPNVSFGFGANGAAGRQGGARASTNISIAGQRAMFNHYTLDGLENTNVEANTFTFLPSIDALQEFKVQTGVYPAEFGRATSQINVSTKSGTNDYHGTLFEFLRNDTFDATQYAFTAARPKRDPFRWNQYGFFLGGPVRIPKLFDGRNRLFFSSNFEGFRDRKQIQSIFNVATSPMRQGSFAEVSPIFDPLTRAGSAGSVTAQPFTGNQIPRARIHSVSNALLEFYPEANGPGRISNYQAGLNRIIDRDQFNQRVDFVESTASNWFGRFSRSDERQVLPGLRLNGQQILNAPWQAMISNTRVFSPTMVNEFRFGVSRFTNDYGNQLAFVRDVVSELKIPGLLPQAPDAWGIPAITLAGMTSFGTSTDGWATRAITFQWIDNFSIVKGTHTIRFGAEIRRDRWNASGYTFPRGEFVFEGVATQNPQSRANTGFPFADYMLGYCRLCRAGVAQTYAKFRSTGQYYYVDDTWKVRPNLTISAGLRYELTPPWFDAAGRLVNIDVPFHDQAANVDRSRHPTLVRTGSGDFYEGIALRFNPAIKVARDGRFGNRLVNVDHNDWAPRLGLAWNPSQQWTVRAGFGVFYSQDSGTPKLDPARNLAGYRFDEIDPDFPDLNFSAPFRGLGGGVIVSTPAVLGAAVNRRTPYTLQYLFNVQRSLGSSTVIEAGYLGSQSRKLEQFRSFNYADPAPTGTIASRVPYPELGRVFIVDTVGKANYNSLGLKLQRRFSSGLTYLTSFTWSKAIDTGSGIRPQGGDTLFAQNEFCIQCDRALSAQHTGRRFVTSAIYELPFGKGQRWLNQGGVANVVLGGWQAGSIITLQDGFPINVFAGLDQCNCGHQMDRVDATGLPTDLPRGQQDPQRFFNTAAYARQPFGRFGNSGRNTVMGPGIIDVAFSTIKNFRFTERYGLEFRFEAFNFPNHPNWGEPVATQASPSFGRVLSTRVPMREMQFGLKFQF